jgi:hypothetical protein
MISLTIILEVTKIILRCQTQAKHEAVIRAPVQGGDGQNSHLYLSGILNA